VSRGAVVWLTGLPASGKSTLARRIVTRLREAGREPLLLDSDELHEVLVPRHGHDEAGRDAFYRSIAGLAALVARHGMIAVVAATAHRRIWRDLARASAPRFVEVYVATPIDECRRRDPKGLYERLGARSQLPGVGVPYEPPPSPEVRASHGDDERAAEDVLAHLRIGGIE